MLVLARIEAKKGVIGYDSRDESSQRIDGIVGVDVDSRQAHKEIEREDGQYKSLTPRA